MVSPVFESPSMVKAVEVAKGVSKKNVPVLISGETGTGKEVLAHIIHDESGRPGKFVPVNCAALPKELVESEMFGSMKGSFTGAHADRIGLIEQAKNGTLFLDELSELSNAMQAKLLRVLQDKRVRPVGSLQEREVDFRLIVAMNVDPHELIKRHRLRSDLFYRVNVIDINLPPLRERIEDILPMATMFLAHYCDSGTEAPQFSEKAVAALRCHPWPGNVRQLQNEMMRLSAVWHKGIITPEDFSQEFARSIELPLPNAPVKTKDEHEKKMLLEALTANHGIILNVAKTLGLGRQTIYNMISRHNLEGWVRRDMGRKRVKPLKLEQLTAPVRAEAPFPAGNGASDVDVSML